MDGLLIFSFSISKEKKLNHDVPNNHNFFLIFIFSISSYVRKALSIISVPYESQTALPQFGANSAVPLTFQNSLERPG